MLASCCARPSVSCYRDRHYSWGMSYRLLIYIQTPAPPPVFSSGQRPRRRKQFVILSFSRPSIGSLFGVSLVLPHPFTLHGTRKPTGREMEGKSASSRALRGNWSRLRIENCVLFIQAQSDESPRFFLPRVKVPDMITHIYHPLGHTGQGKTDEAVCRPFWWSKFYQDLVSYCRGCPVCTQTKPPTMTPRARLQLIISPDSWDEHLSKCLLANQAAVHESTGFSPAFLHLVHELRRPANIHSPLIPAEATRMGE
ncbi:unnamed protein product [Dibothriocephalus latus]|uniref:Integrase zinc-binding domain-containing protein n=1 Tax=Dibothriocephalus latus TaxID=60516 RepID=A0A3P7N5J6_DIBLA|nr:unnamed protein product [Dibothriocephalus latus]